MTRDRSRHLPRTQEPLLIAQGAAKLGRRKPQSHECWAPSSPRSRPVPRGQEIVRRVPAPRAAPRRPRLRRARRRRHDGREPDALGRRAQRPDPRSDRGRGRAGDRRGGHRDLLDTALREPHAGRARARRRRRPRCHAVLQQAASARHRRPLRGGRESHRPACRRLQHPEPRRRQHRAGDDHAPRADREDPGGEAGKRRPRAGTPYRRDPPRPPTPATTTSSSRSSGSAASAASACTRRRPQVAERCALREGTISSARQIDLAPVYDLLKITTARFLKTALNLIGHEVSNAGCRSSADRRGLAQVRDCLARLGSLVAA